MGIHHAHNTSSRRLLPLFHHVVAEAHLRATLEALDFPASSVTEMVDDVRNGTMDSTKFKRNLIEMGEHMAKHEVTDIMQAMKGAVRGGRVDIRDFVQMLLKR